MWQPWEFKCSIWSSSTRIDTHAANSWSEGYMIHFRFPESIKYNAFSYAYQRGEEWPWQNVSNNFTFPYSISLLHCIFQAVQQAHWQKASAEFFGCPANKSGANGRGLTCAVRPRRSWPRGISPCDSWCRSPVLCTGWLTPAPNRCTSGRKGKHILILTVHSQLGFSPIYCSTPVSRKALVAFSTAHNRSGVSWRERIPPHGSL